MALIEKAMPLSSGGLNFKVVGGTTQPSSPKENTIWVNTSTAIGEWQMAAAQPKTRVDGTALQTGDVWIATTATANTTIQVVRKTGVWAKIAKCCQYINGAWVFKTCKVYQSGKWIDCRYILLDGNIVRHSPKVYESTNNSCGAKLQFVETGIYYKSVHDSDKNECYYKIIWEEAVDLTNYDTCYVTFGSISGGRSGNATAGFSTGINYDANFAASVSYAANNTYTIDVSGLSGLHYFRVHGRRPQSDIYVQLYINKVYLE